MSDSKTKDATGNNVGAEIEGIQSGGASWGDYPLDELLIRHENRTVFEVIRRIERDSYVMDPDFQRDFIWGRDKQSRLIESAIMRIPLPVFYLAENDDGRMVVVDGLQRLTTFERFVHGKLCLNLPDRNELHRLRFSELPSKYQNRVEDCNLIFYIIDSNVPERARLDIFERVNGGVPLTRQQMRNSLFMGQSTRFLKAESRTEIFLKATGRALDARKMRDREFVNRFCAFEVLPVEEYRGDMDGFLASCLREMNRMPKSEISNLRQKFRRGLENNLILFGKHAFRKHVSRENSRAVLNASLWDVMSTGFSPYPKAMIINKADSVYKSIHELLKNEDFMNAITYGPNDRAKVRCRFEMSRTVIEEALGAYTN